MKNFPYLILFGCLIVIFIWSVTVCVWVKPALIGISIAILTEVIIVLIFLYFSCYTSLHIGKFVHSDALEAKAIKKAWLLAKKSFLVKKGVCDPDDAMNYNFYKNHLAKTRNELNEALEDYIIKQNKEVNLRSCYKMFYHYLNVCKVEYISEVRLLIHFLLELMVITHNTELEERMMLINFVQNDRLKLFQNKIFIILETG